MPLRDHFQPPFTKRHRWHTVHAMLPMKITATLNRDHVLPQRYAAGPRIHVGSMPEPYIFDSEDASEPTPWAEPSLAAPDQWSNVDDYEVLIRGLDYAEELVAAIEIVCPTNKDCPEHRRGFVAKCGALLRRRVGVTIIDFITTHQANLYGELIASIGRADPTVGDQPASLYAASLRVRSTPRRHLLEAWYYPLAVGQPLPTLPIWLTEHLAVPLDLEPIYEETLKDLKIT